MELAKKGVWVFVEPSGSAGIELLTAARELASGMNAGLACIVLGDDTRSAVNACAEYGADAVIEMCSPEFADYNTDIYTNAMRYLTEKYEPEVLLFEATDVGRDLAPRLAARLDTGLAANCVGFALDAESGRVAWSHAVFGGELLLTAVCESGRPQMATIRPKVFKKGERREGASVPVINESCDVAAEKNRTALLELLRDADDGRPNIEDAEIVVAGGLGVGSSEGFELLWELARLLGGTVGASRAATDAGWISTAHLVGQTGKILSPKLYIACGISGALQHVCGMSGSDVIVAINKDASAPIFRVADYGVVGDMFKVIPAMIEEIKKLRG